MPSYCVMSPHLEATLTTSMTLPWNSARVVSSPVMRRTGMLWMLMGVIVFRFDGWWVKEGFLLSHPDFVRMGHPFSWLPMRTAGLACARQEAHEFHSCGSFDFPFTWFRVRSG